MLKSQSGLALDGQGWLVEWDWHPPVYWAVDGKLVMSSAEVLHEGVLGDHNPSAAVLLEPAHRTQPRLETAVVGLDVVGGIPIGAVPGHRQRLLEH
jgi:hypothetical protein